MIDKPLEQIDSPDLERLKTDRIPEGKTIEYKRDLPGGSDGEKIKFLRAISSMANSSGGDLLFGVDARDGLPEDFPGLDRAAEDEAKLRLENLARDGLEPRVPSLQFKFVQMPGGRSVLIVRTKQSWIKPHRVKLVGHAHFYGRNSAGSYQLDVSELRSAFTLTETVTERIKNFQVGRLAAIGANETPVRLEPLARVVLHLLPLSAFTSPPSIDVVANQSQLRKVSPLGAAGFSWRLNLEGHVNYAATASDSSPAYLQVYRTGAIEAVAVVAEYGPMSKEPLIGSVPYEVWVSGALLEYLKLLRNLGVEPPVYLFLALVGISKHRFGLDPFRYHLREMPMADRDMLVLPELVVESFDIDPHSLLRPLFDLVWNAFGLARSFNYDAHGNWAPR